MEENFSSTQANFDNLNVEFQEVLQEIVQSDKEKQLTPYVHEFQKLYNAFVKSHESEVRLVKRSKELTEDIDKSKKCSLGDREDEIEANNTKKKMQMEIEVLWNQVAESHKIESEKQAKLNELRANISMLNEFLANGNGWSDHQENLMTKLRKQKYDLMRELDVRSTSYVQLKKEVNIIYEQVQKKEKENIAMEEEINSINNLVAEKKAKSEKETRRKGTLDKDLKYLKSQVEKYGEEFREKTEAFKTGENRLKQKEINLRESRNLMEKYLKEYDSLFRKTHKLTEEMQSQWQMNIIIHKENLQREQEIKRKQEDSTKLSQQSKKLEALVDLTRDKICKVESLKTTFENDKDQYKITVNNLTNTTLLSEHKNVELLKKQLEDLVREREILNKMLVKAGDRTQATFDLIKINENTLKNLQNEIFGYRTAVKNQRENIQRLVVERERYEKDAETANKKFSTALEEVKLQEIQVNTLQLKIAEGETRLKQQQNLYEAVRSDRNLYSKNLIESQEEISEMKRKFKIMNHQIEQLKEEITTKDHGLVKEHFDHHKVDKEKEALKNELTRIKKQIQSSEQIIANQEQEVAKLSQIIQEATEEKQRQEKEYNAVINDRDNLRTQLIQRNEELTILYEKIKIQKSTLMKGEYQYEERLKEIATTSQRLAALREEEKTTSNQISCTDSLFNEKLRLEKELLHERTKIKALSEEMKHPLNVHRWRKLEGSDPKRFDLVRKIQNLQKKIIRRTEEVAMKDVLISEKEKLYIELKNVLARQPGPEVGEQLQVYQENLKKKRQQRKAMEMELDMYKQQVNEYKQDLTSIDRSLAALQQKWFDKIAKDEQAMYYETPEINSPAQSLDNQTETRTPGIVLDTRDSNAL